MKKIILVVALVIGIVGASGAVWALTIYSGSLSTPIGITGSNQWAIDVSLSWEVNDQINPGYWTYTYNFSAPKDLSHIIIEVSPSFTSSDIYSQNPGDKEVGIFVSSGNDKPNPNMPGPLYGLKFEPFSGNPVSFVLVTERAPVWGDFYAADGSVPHSDPKLWNYAWNAGYLAADPTDPASSGSINYHILVPDTFGVPEPGMLLLLGAGLLGLVAIRRRK